MIRKVFILFILLMITVAFVSADLVEKGETPLTSSTDLAEKGEAPLTSSTDLAEKEEALICRCNEGEPCMIMKAPEQLKEQDAKNESGIAETKDDDFEDETSSEYISSQIPEGIRNNQYFLRSIELSKQAQVAFDNGFYDGSTSLAEEAIYYARLSDRYVANQLIKESKRLVDWADAGGIEKQNPDAYKEGKAYYETSVEAQERREWNNAIVAAIKSIEILGPLEAASGPILPAQYTVRSWTNHRDCLWNIAGYPFIYGDPWRWREIYNANKARLPNPNNPNVVEPGFVLDIPSIKGETRRGMWDPNLKYER